MLDELLRGRDVRTARWLAATACVFSVGCGGTSSSGPAGSTTASTTPATVTATIGATGGTVQGAGLSVTIPAGALDAQVAVTVTPIASPTAGAVGTAYEIGPTGTQFKSPVTIAFAYTPGELGGRPPASFAVSTLVAGTWQAIGAPSVDVQALTIAGQTMHLSPYALVAQTPMAAVDAGPMDDADRQADASSPDGSVVDGGASDAAIGFGDCGAAPVSFANDVMPVFAQGCSLTSVCHGQMGNTGEANLFLGAYDGTTSPGVVYAGIVDVRSVEDPSMNQVTAGSPATSFLWHKIDPTAQGGVDLNSPALGSGCQGAISSVSCSDCTASMPCGGLMPYLSEPLAAQDLCTVGSWIAQGAHNN
jgi:hypothetical protein